MGFRNALEMGTQKLMEYSANPPSLVALNAIGQYSGGYRGPMQQGVMSPQQMGVPAPMADAGGRMGGGGRGLNQQPLSNIQPRNNKGLLESLIVNPSISGLNRGGYR